MPLNRPVATALAAALSLLTSACGAVSDDDKAGADPTRAGTERHADGVIRITYAADPLA